MSIKKLLFGEKIILQDDFFGIIESDRTRNKAVKSLSWYFEIRIGNFHKNTFIIAEGNYLGIDPSQKEILKDFVQNFETKYACQIDKMLDKNNKDEIPGNWREEYYISTIHPTLDEMANKFDVSLESDSHKDSLFIIELMNKELNNLLKV